MRRSSAVLRKLNTLSTWNVTISNKRGEKMWIDNRLLKDTEAYGALKDTCWNERRSQERQKYDALFCMDAKHG